jgi:hypothetical protein
MKEREELLRMEEEHLEFRISPSLKTCGEVSAFLDPIFVAVPTYRIEMHIKSVNSDKFSKYAREPL